MKDQSKENVFVQGSQIKYNIFILKYNLEEADRMSTNISKLEEFKT